MIAAKVRWEMTHTVTRSGRIVENLQRRELMGLKKGSEGREVNLTSLVIGWELGDLTRQGRRTEEVNAISE